MYKIAENSAALAVAAGASALLLVGPEGGLMREQGGLRNFGLPVLAVDARELEAALGTGWAASTINGRVKATLRLQADPCPRLPALPIVFVSAEAAKPLRAQGATLSMRYKNDARDGARQDLATMTWDKLMQCAQPTRAGRDKHNVGGRGCNDVF